ncbi:MAG: hypothetical protein R3B46_03410 [Phycisphaerales bacterium]
MSPWAGAEEYRLARADVEGNIIIAGYADGGLEVVKIDGADEPGANVIWTVNLPVYRSPDAMVVDLDGNAYVGARFGSDIGRREDLTIWICPMGMFLCGYQQSE